MSRIVFILLLAIYTVIVTLSATFVNAAETESTANFPGGMTMNAVNDFDYPNLEGTIEGKKISIIIEYFKKLFYDVSHEKSTTDKDLGIMLFILTFNRYLMLRAFFSYSTCHVFYQTVPQEDELSLADACRQRALKIFEFMSDNIRNDKFTVYDAMIDVKKLENILPVMKDILNTNLSNTKTEKNKIQRIIDLKEDLPTAKKLKNKDQYEYGDVYKLMLELFGQPLTELTKYFNEAFEDDSDKFGAIPTKTESELAWTEDQYIYPKIEREFSQEGVLSKSKIRDFATLIPDVFRMSSINVVKYDREECPREYDIVFSNGLGNTDYVVQVKNNVEIWRKDDPKKSRRAVRWRKMLQDSDLWDKDMNVLAERLKTLKVQEHVKNFESSEVMSENGEDVYEENDNE